jgi:glycosyltransferase involved in cell wall biosynthesis
MQVVHINTQQLQGGAARGAYWLHQALREAGIDSRFLSRSKDELAPGVHTVPENISWKAHCEVRKRVYQLLRHLKQKDNETFWSLQLIPNGISKNVNRYGADIVHLHWIGDEFVPISSIPKFNAPLVWTIRDMWPFTGGCHYSEHCSGYQYMCGACPQLRGSSSLDLSRLIWSWKKHCWQDLNLHLVAPSEWIAQCLRQSSLFQRYPVRVIPNGVFLKTFYPEPQAAARQKLGLPINKKLVLFGAMHPTESRKGGQQLREALEQIASINTDKSIQAVTFGRDADMRLPLPTVSLGYIKDDEKLRLAYSAASVMVVPSLEEAFGKTVIESMACNTPVVAFSTGGPADIITHKQNGYLAPLGDSNQLARGILWCLAEEDRLIRLSSESRNLVALKYGIHEVARQYTQLYEEILDDRPQ